MSDQKTSVEPVAVTAPAGVDSISMKGMTIYCNGADNPIAYTMNGVIVNLDGYTLYAPGADPVAVVMPERKEIIDHSSHDGGKRKGYNTCLEEVKRLNK